jgi:hypothetical protein
MRWYGPRTSSTTRLAGWFGTFGPEYDVPLEVLALVRKGLAEDLSHEGELCPSFGRKTRDKDGNLVGFLRLWVEHPDRARRKGGKDVARFMVTDERHEALIETEDVDAATEKYLQAAGGLEEPRPLMSLESVRERMWDLTRKPEGMAPEDVAEMEELRQLHRQLDPKRKEFPKFLARRKGTVRTADWGHGDTLDGQMMRRELEAIRKDVESLRLAAETNRLDAVLPRWRGEIRHSILLLPPMERISRMSMGELAEVRDRIDRIKAATRRYNQNLFMEIMGD